MTRKRTVALAVIGLVAVAPLFLIAILALSPPNEPTLPDALPNRLTTSTISNLLGSRNFVRWTINSLIYAGVSVGLILLTATMAGYGFAKKRFPGSDAIFWSFIATLMVPFQAMLIPMFVLVAKLDGVDTYWGLIVPTLANSQAVFLMRQFILDLPEELFEAAKIDGAGEITLFMKIVLPLVRPVLATLGVFVFLWHWNDFLWPLVMSQRDQTRTLTVGLSTLNTENVALAQVMSGALISIVPCLVVFVAMQRYVVESLATSGLKG